MYTLYFCTPYTFVLPFLMDYLSLVEKLWYWTPFTPGPPLLQDPLYSWTPFTYWHRLILDTLYTGTPFTTLMSITFHPTPPILQCSECGGTGNGSCAAGFGVCCVVTASRCGAAITVNSTYLTSTDVTEVRRAGTIVWRRVFCSFNLFFFPTFMFFPSFSCLAILPLCILFISSPNLVHFRRQKLKWTSFSIPFDAGCVFLQADHPRQRLPGQAGLQQVPARRTIQQRTGVYILYSTLTLNIKKGVTLGPSGSVSKFCSCCIWIT